MSHPQELSSDVMPRPKQARMLKVNQQFATLVTTYTECLFTKFIPSCEGAGTAELLCYLALHAGIQVGGLYPVTLMRHKETLPTDKSELD